MDSLRAISAVNEAYLIKVVNQRGDLNLFTPIPESLSLHSESNWGSLGQDLPLIGGAIATAKETMDTLAKFTGASSALLDMASQFPMWKNNEKVKFNIPIELNAFSNAQTEVLDPARLLLKYMAPSQQGGLLYAPGPRFKYNKSTKQVTIDPQYNITVSFGKYLTIPNVIITDVTTQFQSKFTPQGKPTRGTIDLTLETMTAPTAEDIEGWFNGGNYNSLTEAYDSMGKTASGLISNPLKTSKDIFKSSTGNLFTE